MLRTFIILGTGDWNLRAGRALGRDSSTDGSPELLLLADLGHVPNLWLDEFLQRVIGRAARRLAVPVMDDAAALEIKGHPVQAVNERCGREQHDDGQDGFYVSVPLTGPGV